MCEEEDLESYLIRGQSKESSVFFGTFLDLKGCHAQKGVTLGARQRRLLRWKKNT